MQNPLVSKEFDKQVKNKFNIYNSLFLNLPYPKISNVAHVIPKLLDMCRQGLDSGKEPVDIMDSFFNDHTKLTTEEDKIDFMFWVIQYVERLVVLYDSVEDAAFEKLTALKNNLSLKDYIQFSGSRKDGNVIMEKLSTFSTRIVLTAHPTQFYPPSVLDIITKLKNLIINNEINEIDLTLRQLGMTSLINPQKPTPFDEAKNIIYFLRNVYYDAAYKLYSKIKNNIPDQEFDNPEIIQFGFWPGGDRDGNPFVTYETTNDVADELRMNLMKCYYHDVKKLGSKLTFRNVEKILNDLKNNLYDSMFDPSTILEYEDILDPLYQIKRSLEEEYYSLYVEDLEELIDKVKIFKTHFAALDIRQNHKIHKMTVESILKKEGLIRKSLNELKEDELISILLRRNIHVQAGQFKDELIQDTIRNISQLKHIQSKNGESGCNRYIISNSEDIFSVLFVFSLLRWFGWEKGKIPVDIIPLFESMEGMKNSEKIMRKLLDIREYRAHVSQRGNTQTIMLGFSDGTKDGGYLQANWSILKTKENLSAVCDDYNIKPVFFDGRGGPPARGGGKTHRFYASQTDRIANHAIQLTIQGQTITSNYGTQEHFINNFEQLLTAGLSNNLFENKNTISEDSREMIEQLAQISFKKYTELKNHKMFIPYLENKSTLKYYNRAKIGSRPAKRGSRKKLDLKDLRAITFVGSWSQLKQNVPGYFGVGTALKTLVEQGKLEELRKQRDEANS